MKNWKVALPLALIIAGAAGWRVAAAEKANYDLSDAQKTKLELLQTKALRANDQLQAMQGQLQQAVTAFNDACEKVKSDNHLPKDAACDINNPDKISPPKPLPLVQPSLPVRPGEKAPTAPGR